MQKAEISQKKQRHVFSLSNVAYKSIKFKSSTLQQSCLHPFRSFPFVLSISLSYPPSLQIKTNMFLYISHEGSSTRNIGSVSLHPWTLPILRRCLQHFLFLFYVFHTRGVFFTFVFFTRETSLKTKFKGWFPDISSSLALSFFNVESKKKTTSP